MITMPQALLNKLPEGARKIYEAVYKTAINQGKSEKDASIIAIEAVKRKYKQTKEKKWVTKSTALKITVLKSGLFNNIIKFRVPLTNTNWDREGERVTQEVIDDLLSRKAYNITGDLEHERVARLEGKTELRKRLTEYENTDKLYLLESLEESDGEVIATIVMNKSHPLYSTMLKEHKQGKYLYASSEFENAIYNANNEIIKADRLGWSITNDPVNSDTMIREVLAS